MESTNMINTRIILRNDSSDNWEAVKADDSSILLKGETGLEFRPNASGNGVITKIKIGDGVKKWEELPYYEETFEQDFIFTSQFGKYTPDSTGSVSVSAKGKTMSELLTDAFSTEDTDFDVTSPFITLTAKSAQGYKSYEVGTEVSPTYSISFNGGTYPYGPSTGVVVDTYSATFNGETLSGSSGTFTKFAVPDDFKQRVSAKATYNDATASPNSNLGNAVDSKKILAGTTETVYGEYLNSYRSIFYGAVTKELDELTSEDIRALTNGNAYTGARNFEIKANNAAGIKYFIVAIPADNSRTGINNVESTAGMTVNVTGQWVINGKTIDVADARGDENYKTYNLSYWTQDAAIETDVHKVYLG